MMESDKPAFIKKLLSILPFLLIAGLVLVPVGIGFLCTIDTIETVTHEEEYWKNCKDEDYGFPCMTLGTREDQTKCSCFSQFTIAQDIVGDITLYYELESFDQTDPSYANSRYEDEKLQRRYKIRRAITFLKSEQHNTDWHGFCSYFERKSVWCRSELRNVIALQDTILMDNDQFSGHPSMVPAESCGDFRYDEDKPIFPCGKVADSIFNDTFFDLKLVKPKESPVIPISYTGILTEDTTIQYRNPPAEVWVNFTKPKSWQKKTGNAWELDSNSTGVESLAFRAWMSTNEKRKPVGKLDVNNTLPAGTYEIRIEIVYPATAYNGSRKFILEGVYPSSRLSHVIIGSIALILGMIALVVSLVLLFISKKYEKQRSRPSSYNAATLPVSDRISHRPLSKEYEDISEVAKLNNEH